MKLYRVTAEYEFCVVADDDDDAWTTAREHALEAIGDGPDPDISVHQITELKYIPKDERDSLPYGENADDLTCEQVLAASTAVERSEERT